MIKAKKTKVTQVIKGHGDFNETFSILFPKSFMDKVSCVISLNWKTRFSSKIVLGRTSLGYGEKFSHHGNEQWMDMMDNLDNFVDKWHDLNAI